MFYRLVKAILVPILRPLFRPWVQGMENIPRHGPAIIASNHLSFSDSVFLPLMVPRKILFLAKSDYFTEGGLKGRLTASFFRRLGQVPVDRSGGRASEMALRAGMSVLRNGDLLGIYPEGTRSPDGRLYRGRTGVARLALESGLPVIPVAMVDTDKAQPPGTVVPKIHRVGMRIGRPLDFSRYHGMQADQFVLRAITDEIMAEIMALSAQEYVDEYASKAKADLERARRVARASGGVDSRARRRAS